MLTIELNMYHAVALGAFLFWMGGIITDKVRLLNRYCIPAPLVGGLCFSILNCILYSAGIASITFGICGKPLPAGLFGLAAGIMAIACGWWAE